MSTAGIVSLVILGILVILLIALYIFGRKMQTKQAEQQEAINAAKQSVTMLIIDKKKMKLKDGGFPQSVIEQAPKLMRSTKVPVVKAKIGPQIISLICEDSIFDDVPVKKEVKASVSGIYITEVKGLHGKNTVVKDKKKKSVFKRALEAAQEKAGAKPLK